MTQHFLFTPGDTLRVVSGGPIEGCDLGLENGTLAYVLEQHPEYGSVRFSLTPDGEDYTHQGIRSWKPERFEKVDVIDSDSASIFSGQILTGSSIKIIPGTPREYNFTPGDRAPDVLVVDPAPVHLRAYDFEAGDQRFFGRDEAIAQAELRVRERGVRQQVRPVTVEPGDEALVPRWLVQDI